MMWNSLPFLCYGEWLSACWPRRRVSRATVGLNRLLLMSSIQVRRLLCVRPSPGKIKHVILLSLRSRMGRRREQGWMCHVAHTQGKPKPSVCEWERIYAAGSVHYIYDLKINKSIASIFVFRKKKIVKWNVLNQGLVCWFIWSYFFLLLSILMFGLYNFEYIMGLIMPNLDS